ncbi:MAG: hypothetical protein EAZ92_01485 [Candidatus Kapaibacterium sp.]|nr:MAG: hypothetical protein EAZ92_01485 [Candidatus Kapabacteria bacterium]
MRFSSPLFFLCASLLLVAEMLPVQMLTAQAQSSSAAQAERRKWEEPQNIAILNTPTDDFAPSYSPDERLLYFSSQQSGWAQFCTTKFETRRDAASGEQRPRFLAAERLTTSFAQAQNNQSYISFAKDGTILLSAFRMVKTRPFLNIFQAADRKNVFPKPAPLEALNTNDFNAHPALSPSGRSVVFSSTRSGGRGGTDLWTANRDESGAWQQPVNLGEVLNSSQDEITPHLQSDDSLYFASNGFGGKGGFEIYLSVRIDGRWQAPVPLPELNSEYDDSDFAMLPGNIGVFASNRAGGRGGLDLYVSRLVPASQLVSQVEYKIATQTSFLTLEEFLMTDVLPLAPCLFFEPNSAQLPRDLKQLSSEEVSGFSPQNLRPDPLTIYAETLNIVGKRLREFPTATLSIIAPEASNSALSRQRVEAVQKYLQHIWDIDGKRLLTEPNTSNNNTSNTAASVRKRVQGFAGEDAVRCVEFQTNDARILASVRIGGVHLLAKPRKLDVGLDARPRPQLRSWTFTLVGDARDTLFRTTGSRLPYALSLPLEANSWVSAPEEVTARLVGVDSLGRTGKRELTMLVYRLPLDQKRAQKVQDKIIERYRFLLPRDNDAALSPEQTEILREIASGSIGIQNTTQSAGQSTGLSVRIVPFSFEEKSAQQGLERNAKIISDELKRLSPALLVQAPQIEAINDIALPETPQERVMARCIMLIVEHNAQSSSGGQPSGNSRGR